MKAEDLANILKELHEVLQLYPGKDVHFILNDLLKLKKTEMQQQNNNNKEIPLTAKPETDQELKHRIDMLSEKIDSLSMSDIDEKLNSEDLFPSMAYIRYFAKKIGVELTSRQSRINSIHTIKSHIDRMRIDKTISKRND